MNIAIVDDDRDDRLRLEQTLLEYDRIHQLGMVFRRWSWSS